MVAVGYFIDPKVAGGFFYNHCFLVCGATHKNGFRYKHIPFFGNGNGFIDPAEQARQNYIWRFDSGRLPSLRCEAAIARERTQMERRGGE